jgi:CMP-N,N'-diacetyllegionaminic acid synthase
MYKIEVLAIIPARSGSKSIRNKNIRMINGKPLLAYSINHALSSNYINRTIISTDSNKYGNIAKKFGADFPFIRPKEISGDFATDLEVFKHALNWLNENEGYIPDICVQLRPTYPIRDPKEIDRMIEILIDHPEADSVRSIVKAPETPYKMWFLNSNGQLEPVIKSTIKDAYNQPRQALPRTYLQNACIDVIRAQTILKLNSMSGNIILGFEMNHLWDIDEPVQLLKAKKYLKDKTHE